MFKRILQNTRRPEGLSGKMMTIMMNNGHARLAAWGFSHLELRQDMDALDIGCGGGANVSVLLSRCRGGRVTGMDYSPVCVSQSRKKNRKEVAAGRCRIIRASAEKIPFEAGSFDVITAFETVYFWPDLGECFRQVHEKLRPGGTFLICNEDSDPSNDQWTKIIEGMRVYSAQELEKLLKAAGFEEIRIDRKAEKGWICLTARAAI